MHRRPMFGLESAQMHQAKCDMNDGLVCSFLAASAAECKFGRAPGSTSILMRAPAAQRPTLRLRFPTIRYIVIPQ